MGISIALIKDGQEHFLKLLPNMGLVMSDYSSIWDWTLAMKAGYTIDGKVPMEGNEELLGYSHLPEVVGKQYSWNARVYEDGVLRYYGVFSIHAGRMEVAKDEVDFNFESSAIASILVDKTLRQVLKNTVSLGETVTDLISYMNNSAANGFPAYDFAFFPIRAKEFYGMADDTTSNHPDWIGIANFYSAGTFMLEEPLTGTVPPIKTDWKYNAVPQPFVLYVLKMIFKYAGYRLVGDALTNEDMKCLTIFNIKSLDRICGQSAKMMVDTMQTFNATPGYVLFESVEHDSLPISVTVPSTIPNDPSMSGFLFGSYSAYLYLKIGNISGNLTIYARNGGTDVFVSEHVVFPNTEFVTVYTGGAATTGLKLAATGGVLEILPGSYWQIGNLTGKANFHRTSFVDGEMVPDIGCAEFIQAVKQLGVEFIPDDIAKEVEIRMIAESYTKGDVIIPKELSKKRELQLKVNQQGYVKWGHDEADTKGLKYAGNSSHFGELVASAGVAYDMYKYVFAENNYYLYTDLDDGAPVVNGWKLIGPRSAMLKIGSSGETSEWTMKAKLPLMTTIDDPQDMILPLWESEGGSDFPKLKNEDLPLMFCMLYGIYAGSSENYPFASITGALYDGSFAGNKAYLVFDDGERSWFTKYIKPWLLRLSKQETLTVGIPETPDINSYSVRKSIVVVDNVKYRVKEVKRLLGSDKPMVCQLVKLNVE